MSDIKLYQGDCLEIMKQISDKSIDMILCDLPYGTLKSKKCEWDLIIPFDRLWKQYERIIKENGVILLFGTEPFSSELRCSNLKLYKYDLYWYKTLCSNFLMGKKQPFFKIETISVFYNKLPTYKPQMIKGKPYKITESHIEQRGIQQNYNIKHKSNIINNGNRYPDNVLTFNSISGDKNHPCEKPVALCEHLIKTYTNEGNLVLDNCMGSGTTGVACKLLNRNFIGIELDEKYFKVAKERIDNTIVPKRLF